MPQVARSAHQAPPTAWFAAFLVKKNKWTFTWLEEHGVPAGILNPFILVIAVRDLCGRLPGLPVVVGHPNADVESALMRAAEPCRHQMPVAGGRDRGGVAHLGWGILCNPIGVHEAVLHQRRCSDRSCGDTEACADQNRKPSPIHLAKHRNHESQILVRLSKDRRTNRSPRHPRRFGDELRRADDWLVYVPRLTRQSRTAPMVWNTKLGIQRRRWGAHSGRVSNAWPMMINP